MDSNAVPSEWAPHEAIWLGYPSHGVLWEHNLDPARREVSALAKTLATTGRERVKLFVSGDSALSDAERRIGDTPGIEIVSGSFGDIWLRDTGPIFTHGRAVAFRFNGWGGKYILAGDDAVARQLARHADTDLKANDFILEGGALEHDGEGTLLTTRQCLLNDNRNRGWTEEAAEAALRQSLNARKVLWLEEGLLNDHTDGHIDNLARFIAPATVASPAATGDDDPNADVYEATAKQLSSMTDAADRPLKIVRVPSPGRITDDGGEIIPASHMNFIIANGAVIIPDYGSPAIESAIAALTPYFPSRKVLALPSNAILSGGGSFHCITQQEPA